MTIQELLDRVPWGEMERKKRTGRIRSHNGLLCPIAAALRGDTRTARQVAILSGLAVKDTDAVINAADYPIGNCTAVKLRREMLRRMRQARQGQ